MTRTTRIIAVGIVLLLILIVASGLFIPFAGGRGLGWGMMGRGMMGGFGSPFLFMRGIGMFLFWVLLIGGGIWFIQSLGRGSGTNRAAMPTDESPLDILKRRYAKGEISKEQFEEMKSTLGS